MKNNYGRMLISPSAGVLLIVCYIGLSVAPLDHVVRLAPDPGFGTGIDWGYYFPFDPDSHHVGFLEDGSFYIASISRNKVLYFDEAGKLKLEFGQIGQGPGDLTNPWDVSILDNKYVIVSEALTTQRISVFNLRGEICKIIKVDNSLMNAVAIAGGMVAVSTSRAAKNNVVREAVILKEVNSDRTILIDSFERDMQISRVKVNTLVPGTHIARIDKDKLLVGFSANDYLTIYSKDGKQLEKFTLRLPTRRIKRQEIRDFLIKQAGNITGEARSLFSKAVEESIGSMELPNFYPLYYKLAVDDKDRILLYGQDAWLDGSPVVARMYSLAGEFLGNVRFEEGEYKASYPQDFHKGYLYDFFVKKADRGSILFSRTLF